MYMLEEARENEEEYLGVTQIGKVVGDILGLTKGISGQKINETFCELSFQKLIDTKDMKYKPNEKYERLSKKVKLLRDNKDYNFYFRWHKSIILYLLNISLNESVEKNIVKIIKRIQLINLVDLNNINYTKLENELSKIIN